MRQVSFQKTWLSVTTHVTCTVSQWSFLSKGLAHNTSVTCTIFFSAIFPLTDLAGATCVTRTVSQSSFLSNALVRTTRVNRTSWARCLAKFWLTPLASLTLFSGKFPCKRFGSHYRITHITHTVFGQIFFQNFGLHYSHHSQNREFQSHLLLSFLWKGCMASVTHTI